MAPKLGIPSLACPILRLGRFQVWAQHIHRHFKLLMTINLPSESAPKTLPMHLGTCDWPHPGKTRVVQSYNCNGIREGI